MPGITKPSFNRRPKPSGPPVEAAPVLAALAAECRRRFAAAPVGSLARRSAGVASVVLSTTRSVAAARRVLEDPGYRIDDLVRAAALALLDDLDAGTGDGSVS